MKQKANGEMLITNSPHYAFHYYATSRAAQDIEKIIAVQEKCYAEICLALGIATDLQINYYFADTPQEIGVIYGDNEPANAFASPPDAVYAVYNDELQCIGYHEDAHLLSLAIGKPSSAFLREGLAMYFDQTWWGRSNEAWVTEFISSERYLSVIDLLGDAVFYSHFDSLTYPIAGAWTRFLIQTRGMERYLSLYSSKDDSMQAAIEAVYAMKLTDLEREFLQWISNLSSL